MSKFPPMPQSVYQEVMRRVVKSGVDAASPTHAYDLHHALVSKSDVRGLPEEEKAKIHDARNILVIPSEWNASHANVPSKEEALKMLSKHYTMDDIQDFLNGINFKTKRSLPQLDRCHHGVSNYEVNPDDLSVWCFKCNPPRRISSPTLE